MDIRIHGRRSSHYTRMVRIVAEELGVGYELIPIFDLLSDQATSFAGNPALKLPAVEIDGQIWFGSGNGCRALARAADKVEHLVWPEQLTSAHLMNAHEVLNHALSAQVEVVLHEIVEKRPADRSSRKRRQSLLNCLSWLDGELPALRKALPSGHISLFEIGLYCLLSHLPFRNPIDLSALTNLCAFVREFADRPSAKATPYRFDAPPSP